MPTETELALEQTQQGVSYEVSIVIMDLVMQSTTLPQPLKVGKTLVLKLTEITHISVDILTPNSILQAGNLIKEILIKLNLPDHRSILTDSKIHIKMVMEENQFPVLSRMAMDILSVQASSVASESAFSTSGRLLTIRRTRLTPESLEIACSLKGFTYTLERKQNTSPLELP
ncbi:zinc finger BED domain-containing protein RICESLEEPER 2 [Tanacetum coccineum]